MLLLEKLDCRIDFPEKQGCCDQPVTNGGYIKEVTPGTKGLIAALEGNDDPAILPASSYTHAAKSYPAYLVDEPGWASRAKKVAARMQDLTSFIVNTLGVTGVGASLQGRVMYHPSCSLTRRLRVRDEPFTLLKNVRGLKLSTFAEQDTCHGFGSMLSIKMTEIFGEMVKEKVAHLMEVRPEYLISADVSCLLSISGRLRQEG